MSNVIIGNMTLWSLLVTIIGLIILWIIVSISVWLAGKTVTGGKATCGEAMIDDACGTNSLRYHIVYSGLPSGGSNRFRGIRNRINFSSHGLDMGLQSKL